MQLLCSFFYVDSKFVHNHEFTIPFTPYLSPFSPLALLTPGLVPTVALADAGACCCLIVCLMHAVVLQSLLNSVI